MHESTRTMYAENHAHAVDDDVQWCDLVTNALLAKTDPARFTRWDEQLKIYEHWGYILRAARDGMRVALSTAHGVDHHTAATSHHRGIHSFRHSFRLTIQLIVTHAGGAHKDDFLACSLLAHLHGVPIQRRDPTDDDLADPSICVVDIGGVHDLGLNNFDHHQFPRDAPPLCALSLVLQSIGLYEDALSFCAWLRPTEWLDTLGPNEAANLMGIPRTALGALNSPVDMTLLNRFASHTELNSESPIYQVMCMVGEDMRYFDSP